MVIIGITGGSGSGKTTVLECYGNRGAFIVDADAVYHRLLRKDTALLDAIASRFPEGIVDGAVDTKRLGRSVYGDPGALAELGRITHVYVLREIDRMLDRARRDSAPSAVIDAIALVESGLDGICDRVIGVTAPADVRARRIAERDNVDIEYAKMRIAAQKSDEFYRENCDYVLENNGEPQEFRERANELYNKILSEME